MPVVTSVLTVVLWPLRSILSIVFPFNETDGLSSAVTAKAAQYFVQYLRSVLLDPAFGDNSNNDTRHDIVEAFSTSSFAALKEDATARQSLIFLYLHSPLHGQAREACEKLLGREPLASWITEQDNVMAYGVSIHTGQGAHLQNLLHIECFPAVAILQPGTNARSSLNLLYKAEGWDQCAPNILLPRLHYLQQTHRATLTEREVRRLHREQEEELRRQQDAEFEATLQADRDRERKVQVERDILVQKLEQERLIQQEVEDKIQRWRDMILPEPANGSGAEMRFCLPTGAKLTRRFRPEQTVGALRAYLRIHCLDNSIAISDNIGLSTNFPRRSYNNNDDQTLLEAELAPRAVLMVQDLDA
jgi:FAS-associated factor 2